MHTNARERMTITFILYTDQYNKFHPTQFIKKKKKLLLLDNLRPITIENEKIFNK